MTGSLVFELQRLAQRSDSDVNELLRHAKVVATKLNQDDARAWIDWEISGYPPTVELPGYRIVPSILKLQNPYHGWQPVTWGTSGNLQKHFATAKIRRPISEIEAATRGEGEPQITITQGELEALMQASFEFAELPSARFVSRGSLLGVLEGVRAKILDWSLDLERKGIIGREMSFSPQEKQEATKVTFRVGESTTALLFLSANPDKTSPLDVEQEQNRIAKVRNGSKHQNVLRIESLPNLDLPELAKSLRLHKPVVIHFSGHGASDGSLLMRDENGNPCTMSPTGLAKLFSLHRSAARLVVLNACYSHELAKLLTVNVDFVVGMSGAVSDAAAILFAQVFYGSLFDGESLEAAFATGAAAVEARYESESDRPVLMVKAGSKTDQFRLIE